MAYCQVCKSEISKDTQTCAVCGHEFSGDEKNKWVFIGMIDDKISADYGKESLKSYDIPAVIFSKSGFFGDAGLPLNPFYSMSQGQYEVSVPTECVEEATDILTMVLGESWHRKDC